MSETTAGRMWTAPKLFVDVALCVVATVVSALAYLETAGGSVLRLLLVAPTLLFVPGYLLVEATRLNYRVLSRGLSAMLAVGVSIAIMALLALSTALFPHSFRPLNIVAVNTVFCLVLASVCVVRRRAMLHRLVEPEPESASWPSLSQETSSSVPSTIVPQVGREATE